MVEWVDGRVAEEKTGGRADGWVGGAGRSDFGRWRAQWGILLRSKSGLPFLTATECPIWNVWGTWRIRQGEDKRREKKKRRGKLSLHIHEHAWRSINVHETDVGVIAIAHQYERHALLRASAHTPLRRHLRCRRLRHEAEDSLS